MMRLPRPRQTRQRENTIALINIVFLMLIFFLIAGSLTPPLDNEVKLIAAMQASPVEPPEALFIAPDGTLRWRGGETTVDAYLSRYAAASTAQQGTVKIAADQALSAERLIDIVGELRAGGAERIVVITERASP
jgi:biopolymer transport protein ExbD